MMTKKIIVNASGAKVGGAKTIIDTYLNWISKNDSENEYIFIVGYQPNVDTNNIKIIHKATSGLITYLFSVLLIAPLILKHKPDKLISFNNVNLLLPLAKRITYFHQSKIFEPGFSIKSTLYHFAISLLKGTKFITQSNFIQSQFSAKYPKHQVIAKWPGFVVPEPELGDIYSYCEKLKAKNRKLLLVPITDVRMTHKYFGLSYKYAEQLNEQGIDLVITSQQFDYPSQPNFHFVGNVSRAELFALYKVVDGAFFTSKAETVGLPIFEAASTGLPVWLLARPYAKHFYQQFNQPPNIVLFDEQELMNVLHLDNRYIAQPSNIYSDSDWTF